MKKIYEKEKRKKKEKHIKVSNGKQISVEESQLAREQDKECKHKYLIKNSHPKKQEWKVNKKCQVKKEEEKTRWKMWLSQKMGQLFLQKE